MVAAKWTLGPSKILEKNDGVNVNCGQGPERRLLVISESIDPN